MRFTEEICRSIGQQLKQARIAKKHKQRELAGELRVSRRMVIRYEKGEVAPTGETLARAVRYVGGLDLPGYDYKLTVEAVEQPRPAPGPAAQQIELPLGVPQEFPGATVRVTRKDDSMEIFAVVSGLRRR